MIGSACDGGLADQPDGMCFRFYASWKTKLTFFLMKEIPSPYNRSGALSVWSNNGLVILDGHSTRRGNFI